MELKTRNTNPLAPLAYGLLQAKGEQANSRNGRVLRLMEPLTICLTRPWERVNFCPVRDANPFFHYIEACAMLANLNSAPFLSHFASNMANYSDDGATYNSYYGTRLRSTWGDQLNQIIDNLRKDPESRQEVALIWHPKDLTAVTKDKACNLMLLFAVDPITDHVVMTSLNRSNDAIWGMVSGANIVHLSVFHEYVATALGRSMGPWYHFSNNFHVYLDNPKWAAVRNLDTQDFYSHTNLPNLVPLFPITGKTAFDAELQQFIMAADFAVSDTTAHRYVNTNFYRNRFVKDAAVIFNVWQCHKHKLLTYPQLLDSLKDVAADDWRLACSMWLSRRHVKSGTSVSS